MHYSDDCGHYLQINGHCFRHQVRYHCNLAPEREIWFFGIIDPTHQQDTDDLGIGG